MPSNQSQTCGCTSWSHLIQNPQTSHLLYVEYFQWYLVKRNGQPICMPNTSNGVIWLKRWLSGGGSLYHEITLCGSKSIKPEFSWPFENFQPKIKHSINSVLNFEWLLNCERQKIQWSAYRNSGSRYRIAILFSARDAPSGRKRHSATRAQCKIIKIVK